jgi:hypothetical protein
MPQTPKKLKAKQLRYSGNRVIEEYLFDLVDTGLYGRSPGEAAERLVSQGIERAIANNTIKRRVNGDTEKD